MTTNLLPPDIRIFGGDEVGALAGANFGLASPSAPNSPKSADRRSKNEFTIKIIRQQVLQGKYVARNLRLLQDFDDLNGP
jgi:hypothetical protein